MNIFLVILLGLTLRITYIIKPEGLWNDEYVSWMIASTPFGQGFWQEILKQCHMPLYYLYLKPFSLCSDLILRLTSVFPSVLAIWIMYLTGREFSEKCGKYSALITAVLPFLIYYSQEVRLYSLVFLLSALILLFLVKIIKNPNKKNIIFYSIFALILIFTHVLGIIYVTATTLYLIYKKKIFSKKVLLTSLLVCILLIPLGINILRQLPSSQWWGIFSYTNLMFLFSDFLSPILTNNINAPPVFYYSKTFLFVFLITLPPLIGILGIFLGCKKLKDLFYIPLFVIVSMVILASAGKLVFITKYLIEILPLFILMIAVGFDEDQKWKNILLSVFITINLLSIFTAYYPSKKMRHEGNNLPAKVLNYQNPDRIIFTYYEPDRFQRYMTINPITNHISKLNRFDYVNNPEKILKNIKSGENISIVFLDSVSFIPENRIKESKDRNLPEMFITFSIIRHKLQNYMLKEFNNPTAYKIGSWVIINGTKK